MIPEHTINPVVPKGPYRFVNGIMVPCNNFFQVKLPKIFAIPQYDEDIAMLFVMPEGGYDYPFIVPGIIRTPSVPEMYVAYNGVFFIFCCKYSDVVSSP